MDQASSSGGEHDVENSDVTDLDDHSLHVNRHGDGSKADDESDTESLTNYMSLSDTESLPAHTLSDSDTSSVESVNSAAIIERRVPPTPTSEGGGGGGRARRRPSRNANNNNKRTGIQFLEYSKEIRDVPAQTFWDIVKDHKGMVNVCSGIMEGVDFLQGHGGSGSIFVIILNPRYTPAGSDNYVIHKLEVSDDISRMYVVRCVGGMHQKRYHHYLSSVKVLPHEVLGVNSCVVTWRLEYKLRNRRFPVSEETKNGYMNSLDRIRDRHVRIHQVERPLIIPEEEEEEEKEEMTMI